MPSWRYMYTTLHNSAIVSVCVCVCVQVTVPEQYIGAVLSDLTSLRRAQVKGVLESKEGEVSRVVLALVPLASLLVNPLDPNLLIFVDYVSCLYISYRDMLVRSAV